MRLSYLSCWLLLLAPFLGGCATGLARPARGVVAAPTDIEVVVFNDGFHSGLIVPLRPELVDLDPQKAGTAATLPWLELGFGADAWVATHDPGCCTATWLAFSRSAGVVMCEHLPEPTRKPRDAETPIRFWSLRFTEPAWQRLVAEVHTWAETGLVQPRQADKAVFMRYATKRWSSFHNCSDFVVETLAPAGLQIAWRPIYTIGGFAAVMDGVQRDLQRDGVTVIDVSGP